MIRIPTTQYDAKLEPLKEAVESGNSDFLRRWLEEGQPICNPESKRESLLSVAVKSRQFSMLELLLGAGNWREEYPRALSRALGEAVRSKQIDIVRLLLANGASVESVPWWKIADTHSMEMTDVFCLCLDIPAVRDGRMRGNLIKYTKSANKRRQRRQHEDQLQGFGQVSGSADGGA